MAVNDKDERAIIMTNALNYVYVLIAIIIVNIFIFVLVNIHFASHERFFCVLLKPR